MDKKKLIKANDVFIDFEKKAIEWAKQYQIAKVGDIVTSYLGGKRQKKFLISSVEVTIGRNKNKTTRKTLVIKYVGRRLNSKGELIDDIGVGRYLREFVTNDGKIFNHSENEVNEVVNDIGLSFHVDFDEITKAKYPNAYQFYTDNDNIYTR